MSHSPVTVSIAFVHSLLSGVRARGLPRETFLADAGIAPDLLQQVSARVTADQCAVMLRLMIERLDDEAIGLLSQPLKRGSMALLARSALGATTLEVALRRVARGFALLQHDVVPEPVRKGALAGLALGFSNPTAARSVVLHELLLRTLWLLLAWMAGGRLQVARFDFAFESPSHASSYGKIFPAPLQFGQEQSAFWFDADLLQHPVRRDEAALRAFLADAPANMILPRRGDDVVSSRVREYLLRVQPAWPDLAASAEALHMAASTLQRRLATDGTSFQVLKDELRRDLAIVRLTTSQLPLATLADELAFADTTAFQRAFKGWTGSTPGTYRRGRA